MLRKIVSINEEKCNGCGLCITACHEDAIELIDGKAKLISDEYCDGLGDCLPKCPVDAIEIVEREAAGYDDDLVKKRIEEKKLKERLSEKQELSAMPCGCPGTAAKKIDRGLKPQTIKINKDVVPLENNSELMQWPVQLKLINTKAPYLKGANLLVAADCTAYAYGDFHKEFIKDHITVIGCPKLDDVKIYTEKLKEILLNNQIKSLTVVRMSVPCCAGIVSVVKNAMLEAKVIIPYKEVTIGTDGSII